MKKTFSVISKAFTALIVLLAVCMMIFTVVSVTTVDRQDRSIFGYRMMKVLSDSMSKTDFDAGDIIFIKETDPKKLKEGDIIAFYSTDSDNLGEIVTHKIRELTTAPNGEAGFVTYGTTTGVNDQSIVTYHDIIGKYQGRIPFLGRFFEFLTTPMGYVVCILLPFLLLIITQGINSIKLFKKYKAEQLAEINAEKENERAALEAERQALAEERKKQEEMMQKLLKMQESLENTQSQKADADGNSSANN